MGKQIAEKYQIKKGATAEQIIEIARRENIKLVMGTKDDEIIDEDQPFLLVVDKSHCVACLPPCDERSQAIYDLVKKFNQSEQYVMAQWKPKI